MRRGLRLAALAALLSLTPGACGGSAPAAPPPVLTAAETIADLAPRHPQKAVLANFWATW